jgi:hypothetical protein
MAIKFSDYLNKIIRTNYEISTRNEYLRKDRERIVKFHPEWSTERVQQSLDITHMGKGREEPRLHVPTQAELEDMFHTKTERLQILAKIGDTGKQVHKVTVEAINTPDGYILYHAISDCGSQKWSVHGTSLIYPLESDELSKVDCDRCLGIRVKGGKDAGKPVTQYKCNRCGYTSRLADFRGFGRQACPKCRGMFVSKVEGTGPQTRARIDPDTRPKEYSFYYMTQYLDQPGRAPEERHEQAKGMSPEEAQAKIIRNWGGPDIRLFGFRLRAIWAWNGSPVWHESRGEPAPVPMTYPEISQEQAAAIVRAARKKPATNPVVGATTMTSNPKANPRPPARWWAKMWSKISSEYPRKKNETLKHYREGISKLTAGIWWGYPDATRAKLIHEYDQMKANPGSLPCPMCGAANPISSNIYLKCNSCHKPLIRVKVTKNWK